MNKNPENKNEVLRYLGYRGQDLDQSMENLIEESMEEMRNLINLRYDYKVFQIFRRKDKLFLDNNFQLRGNYIKKHLDQSDECILLAATLGHDVDTRIRYCEKFSMTKALVLDACATVAIEEICDSICEDIKKKIKDDNRTLTTRYSPGYGDLPLNIQKEFISVLGVDKSIGLTSTSSSILIPRKSVTAIMGIIEIDKNIDRKIDENNCLTCHKYSTCIYSKGDEKCGS